MTRQYVAIYWEDAWNDYKNMWTPDEFDEATESISNVSVGVLLHKNKSGYLISHGWVPKYNYSVRTEFIPHRMITKVEELIPQEFVGTDDEKEKQREMRREMRREERRNLNKRRVL